MQKYIAVARFVSPSGRTHDLSVTTSELRVNQFIREVQDRADLVRVTKALVEEEIDGRANGAASSGNS